MERKRKGIETGRAHGGAVYRRRSGLRRSRVGRQMTAEVRKLAKGLHSTLLLNSLMTVWGLNVTEKRQVL